jgi:hypothetical protein
MAPSKDRVQELCELAEREKDPHKLLAIIEEANRLLAERNKQYQRRKQQ